MNAASAADCRTIVSAVYICGDWWRFPPFRLLLPLDGVLFGFPVRGHRSEIMLGVLVVVLRPDDIAGLGFSLGEGDIPLIIPLRALRIAAPRLGTGTV
jgi:hypothetical protein